MQYNFFVGSDLKKFGTTEDGEDYLGEIYFVIAEDDYGNRWQSTETFSGCVVEDNSNDYENSIYFRDTREDAQFDANTLIEKMKANIEGIDIASAWTKISPTYGSPVYDESELVNFEREIDERSSMSGYGW